jgi:hypothetical protein
MDDRTVLESLLFAHLEPTNATRKLQILPNFSQGINISTQNGQVLYSIQPGVSTEGASLLDDSGEKIATIRDGVHDSVVYDFGMGETAVSRPDIFGGSKIESHGEGFIGFAQPSFDGGLELQGQYRESIASIQGNEISLDRNENMIDFPSSVPANTFSSSTDLYEIGDTANAVDDAMDVLDTIDVLGDLF